MSKIKTSVNKFGANHTIGTGTTPEDFWQVGGTYTGFPVGITPETVTVTSNNSNDTGTGTGARTVCIVGLTSNTSTEYTEEILTMNGTTGVVSTNTWYRINRIYILTGGSTGSNIGTITCNYTTTTSVIFGTILPTHNQSTIGAFTIPYKRTGFLNKWTVSFVRSNGSLGSGTISIRTRDSTITDSVFRIRDYFEISTGSPLSTILDGNPIELPNGCDIKLTVESVSDNNSSVSGTFNITYS